MSQGFTTRLPTACRPWGILDWTYDKIGNRLTETRDGANPDTYVYLTNGTGNTPILSQVVLGVLGTRDYTWGAAGHLEEVAAGANVLDFGAGAEGRLSGVDRTAASETVAFSYDGRSFLRSAQETAGGTRSVKPLYDSAGLVHTLRRQASPTDPEELVVFLYLAGRPVAQLGIDGTGTETWTYLTTDHLGTPLIATDDAGALVWQGAFEPFGRDFQRGTPSGALENSIFLRFPGQWEDGTWSNATSGAGIYLNLNRWIEPQTGRYTRPDPMRAEQGRWPENSYGYTTGNPVVFTDPLGLARRWYAPGVVYNGGPQPVCAIFGEGECLVVKPGKYSSPLDDADFVLVPASCKWIKIAVGVATVRDDGTVYLPLSSRLTGGGRESTEAETQQFDDACDGNCECSYCGG